MPQKVFIHDFVEHPSVWICLMIIMIKLKLCIFGQNTTEVTCPSQGVHNVKISYN